MRDAWDRIPWLSLSSSRTQLFSINFNMFNKFTTNQVVRHGHSDCATYVVANVKDATAIVRFTNGNTYKYTNVSRTALIKLIMQPNISVGRWINDNLVYCYSKTARLGECTKYDFNVHAFVGA